MGKQRARNPKEIAQRKEAILQETERIFLEQRYEDITLVSIAKDLQISRPSLYNYFTSKEEIFLALLKGEYLLCQASLKQAAQGQLTTEAFISLLVTNIFDRPLFVKLLSLHAAAMEEKLGYERMYQFKTDTQDFFHTLERCIQEQFPKTSEAACTQFMIQFHLLMTTAYQYSSIPADQAKVMQELNIFGTTPLLDPREFYKQTLLQLCQSLEA
ncbi:hypothetical protein BU202_03775 [Streptococcus cuniculi]|uniref:HTH tetR-type domain-containing protein n=1 Tax=Streptococcus cuniculi TaxID=1432788 RepID=A0A1Q8E8K4_9STRE|nr:TetR family transcriptional regulator [Streptococcus cuniculi]OLF48120.1 hypothetical protein BU202_03775 [Streptococcus cuniculi]